MKKIVLSGGGTGGHIYPALAIKEIISTGLSEPAEFLYIGQPDGMESKIVPREAGVSFAGARAQGMPRDISMKWFTFPVKNLMGISDAYSYLKSFSPDLVVTTGGFVAFPVLLASKLLGFKFAIHEQNAAMGVTNRLFASSASKIMLTYSGSYPSSEKVAVTGNPVRKVFSEKFTGKGLIQKNPDNFVILFTGGSRGASSINKACVDLASEWLESHPEVIIIQITGERDYQNTVEKVKNTARHKVYPYLHEMREAFEVSDIIVSRAGATILAEIGCLGKPAILIPYPFATDNHQEKNARVLEEAEAAKIILDRELNCISLKNTIESCMNKALLNKMSERMKNSRPINVEERIFDALKPLLF
ncbi:MAG: undecaprenyldiphospho-muramoylpentapeptide beta-N-acetylglucosaminyltransferase [Candidatus Riflebacteria bacterium]|nr:undecaprenyldiphospho-muramoylpentapeptide beta-N-acetylglucosaminyltransferase [Candidatus Riflebacteria bacterium]